MSESRLGVMISVRFAPEAAEAIEGVASEEGITVSSWIRRLVQGEIEEPEIVEIVTEDGTVRVRANAMREIVAALTPYLIRHGSFDLHIGPLYVEQGGVPVLVRAPASTERPSGLIEGSGRKGEPKMLGSSLTMGHTFPCPHLSIGNVARAECGQCGPPRAAP